MGLLSLTSCWTLANLSHLDPTKCITLSIMTLSIKALGFMGLNATHSINYYRHNDTSSSVVSLSIIKPSVIGLSAVMMNVMVSQCHHNILIKVCLPSTLSFYNYLNVQPGTLVSAFGGCSCLDIK